MNSRVFLNMNIYKLFSRYDDRRWPTLLAVSAVSLVLGCAAIHPRLSAAQPGSQKAGALHVGDDLPSNTNSAVVGRVVDVDGNPLAFVTVGLSPVANNKDDYYMNDVVQRTITDADGRFAIPPIAPGDYQIAPLPDIEINQSDPRREWLPRDYRKYAAPGVGYRRWHALTAVFAKRVVSVKAGAAAPEVELRAVPQVLFAARIIDGRGKAAGAMARYRIDGRLNGERWSSEFRPAADRADTVNAFVPLGLRDVRVNCAGDNVYWTWEPGGPRLNFYHVVLKAVDGDRLGILVQRFKTATLEIRIRAGAGELPKDLQVGVYYPRRWGADGGPIPTRVAPGIYRLDQQLLPGRDTDVQVRGSGFKSTMTKPFQFTEEGQQGVIELTLEPGQSTPEIRSENAVPIVLRTPDGRPIIAPLAPVEPFLEIVCRAVDKDSGQPVADAIVTFGVEQRTNEDGEEEYDAFDSHDTKTDQDGRFTVRVPEKYLPDSSPKRKLDVRVTIKHPRYVTYYDTADAREIAAKGVSDAFPAFHAVKLVPARALTGRLLGADGTPLAKVTIYKQYDMNAWPRDAEFPVTGEDGRFSAKAPMHTALKLEFRTSESARIYHDVGPDQTDLGNVRVKRGEKIIGRIVDADGMPVPWISVTTPPMPDAGKQPNFVYTTDKDGRFESDGLPPGTYLVKVGGIHRTEDGKSSPTAVKDAPGVYVPFPVVVRDAQAVPELTLRPVESVRFIATLAGPLPKTDPRRDPVKVLPPGGDAVALAAAYQDEPVIGVKGNYRGVEWVSQYSFAAAAEQPGTYTVHVPKGLTDATLFLGIGRWFQLDANSPELFGTSYRVGQVDSDRLDIRVRPYRLTTISIVVVAPRPDQVKVSVRYLREAEMKAAGAVFDALPPQSPDKDGKVRLWVLPGAELEVSATAPGSPTASARVRLTEGETREVSLRFDKIK
jgi:hypothetical protein